MREKNIKRQVMKQLKKEFPNWRRLSGKVRIYAELDADCDKRRRKRDESEYLMGYRIQRQAFRMDTG